MQLSQTPFFKKSTPSTIGYGIAHVVKAGETLSKIAGIYYNDIRQWPTIAIANGISNPNLIQVGQRLTIPPGVKVAQEIKDISTPKIVELSTMVLRGTPPMTAQQKTGWTIAAAIAAMLLLGG